MATNFENIHLQAEAPKPGHNPVYKLQADSYAHLRAEQPNQSHHHAPQQESPKHDDRDPTTAKRAADCRAGTHPANCPAGTHPADSPAGTQRSDSRTGAQNAPGRAHHNDYSHMTQTQALEAFNHMGLEMKMKVMSAFTDGFTHHLTSVSFPKLWQGWIKGCHEVTKELLGMCAVMEIASNNPDGASRMIWKEKEKELKELGQFLDKLTKPGSHAGADEIKKLCQEMAKIWNNPGDDTAASFAAMIPHLVKDTALGKASEGWIHGLPHGSMAHRIAHRGHQINENLERAEKARRGYERLAHNLAPKNDGVHKASYDEVATASYSDHLPAIELYDSAKGTTSLL